MFSACKVFFLFSLDALRSIDLKLDGLLEVKMVCESSLLYAN